MRLTYPAPTTALATAAFLAINACAGPAEETAPAPATFSASETVTVESGKEDRNAEFERELVAKGFKIVAGSTDGGDMVVHVDVDLDCADGSPRSFEVDRGQSGPEGLKRTFITHSDAEATYRDVTFATQPTTTEIRELGLCG